MITDEQLRRILPKMPEARRVEYGPHLNDAMQQYGIDTLLRTAAFIAQLAHESGSFRYMEEIWGPTDAQRRYEPPSTLAKGLGNTQPGDGKRYKGRGPIQITGRHNYGLYGGKLGLDLVGQPELAATPAVGFRIAGLYWHSNGLNALADAQDFVRITRRINGGTNGLADRQRYYEIAQAVLAEGFVAAAPVTRDAARVTLPMPLPPADMAPLGRGHELIARSTARAATATAGGDAAPAARPAATKKAAARKAPAKKASTKKASTNKTATKKAPTKKPPTKKAAARTAPPTQAPVKKTAPKQTPAPKAAAGTTRPARKTAAKPAAAPTKQAAARTSSAGKKAAAAPRKAAARKAPSRKRAPA